MAVSVHIAHNDTTMREGLKYALSEDGFEVTGCSASGQKAQEAIITEHPDILLIDVQTASSSWITQHTFAHTAAQCVVTTSDPNPRELASVIAAGADAYVTSSASHKVIAAIHTVASDAHPIEQETLRDVCALMTKSTIARVVDQRVEELTSAEIRVLNLLAGGASNQAIAKQLNITVNTVKTHLRHVYDKLDFDDRTQAALWAAQNLSVPQPVNNSKYHP